MENQEKQVIVVDKTQEKKENVMENQDCKECCGVCVEKHVKVTAKTFVLASLKEKEKTIVELAQEYIDKGHTQKDLAKTKLQMAVTLNTLKKEGKTQRVGGRKHGLVPVVS